MAMTKFLQEAKKFEIQPYKKPKNIKLLKEDNVPFSGSPHKHPYDSAKVVLIADPYSNNTFYYEFKTEDITFVEELPNMVNEDGETINMARVWIKKKRVGIRCTPFVVEDISSISNNKK